MGNKASTPDIERGNYICCICRKPFYKKTIWGQDVFCTYDCKIKYNKIINDYYDNNPGNYSPRLLGDTPTFASRTNRVV